MATVCFVTGATGFVGANLLPMLAGRHRLRCLLRPGTPVDALAVPHEVVSGTLLDAQALEEGVRGADVVVHLAALVSFRPEDRTAMFAVNAGATAVLAGLARAAGVRRFLHVSTISAVGWSRTPRELDETAPYNFGPLRVGYCDSKHAAEAAVRAEVARGLDAVIVNPPSMFGAGDRRKAGSLIEAVLRGRLQLAPPGGLNVADVQSVCGGCLLALDRGRTGERYILGGENLTGRELLARIAGVTGGRVPRHSVPAWTVRTFAALVGIKEKVTGSRPPLTSEVLRLAPCWQWFSSAKAERELGYTPGAVEPGIRAAIANLRKAPLPGEPS